MPYSEDSMSANTKYKDSVFSFLFSDPASLRELYEALEGVTLPPDVPVTINTLQDVLFLDRVNDLSFTVGDILVLLVEHQSTINPNMALRLLMYIARVYEKILGDKNLYASRALTIPRPEFFVLYNGTAPYPDEQVLRLSDLFPDPTSLGLSGKENPALDLAVRVININEGRNEEIVRRCTVLNGYSAFVARVREYEKELGNKEEAMKAAIKYCREHDILKEFLERHSSEVMNMLLTEWNWDDALAVRYEEGLETGLETGLEKGREEGKLEGREEGKEEGREEIARNALARGLSPEDVSGITGLDLEIVNKIAGQ
ncbi:MAG: Rpn family recombination-promoting nuclease/putative transposase [Spirochaetaceae bacterium]|nr:Rpn family recombination-promoting nuclease/putative transposase [Spirochaetaceae bacterium]